MVKLNKGWWDTVEVQIKVSQKLKGWCHNNHGAQGSLSFAIASTGRVTFDRRDKLDVERMAIRLQNTVPPYLKRDVQALINRILTVS